MKREGDRAAGIAAVRAMAGDFAAAGLDNFSLWHMQEYLFGCGELVRSYDRKSTAVERVF